VIKARQRLDKLDATRHSEPNTAAERRGRGGLHSKLFGLIETHLKSPHVFGEERRLEGLNESLPEGTREPHDIWVVDALDGERMFWRHFPNWCVSVGGFSCRRDHKTGRLKQTPLCGVVYNPPRDEMFVGLAEGGALLIRPEGRRIERLVPSGRDEPGTSMIATHLSTDPANKEQSERFVQQALGPLVQGCNRVVMLGCGQLALCYVAAGRLDAFLNVATSPWNVHAGSVILRAVRNTHKDVPPVTDFSGNP
jgi:myo-inositol-1(or 4)-monophosphatase